MFRGNPQWSETVQTKASQLLNSWIGRNAAITSLEFKEALRKLLPDEQITQADTTKFLRAWHSGMYGAAGSLTHEAEFGDFITYRPKHTEAKPAATTLADSNGTVFDGDTPEVSTRIQTTSTKVDVGPAYGLVQTARNQEIEPTESIERHRRIPLLGGDRIQLKDVISQLHSGAAAIETPADLTLDQLKEVANDLHNLADALEQHGYVLALPNEIGQPQEQAEESVRLSRVMFDGKPIAFSDRTEFLVQVGRGKGGYKTKHKIIGNLGQALLLYKGINIAAPYKKRLLMPSSPKPVLKREVGE